MRCATLLLTSTWCTRSTPEQLMRDETSSRHMSEVTKRVDHVGEMNLLAARFLHIYHVSILWKQVYKVEWDRRLLCLILGQEGPCFRFVVAFWLLVIGFSEAWQLQNPHWSYVWVSIQLWQSKRKMGTCSVEESLVNVFEKCLRRQLWWCRKSVS